MRLFSNLIETQSNDLNPIKPRWYWEAKRQTRGREAWASWECHDWKDQIIEATIEQDEWDESCKEEI